MVLVMIAARPGSLKFRWKYAAYTFVLWLSTGVGMVGVGLYAILAALPRAIWKFIKPPQVLDLNSLNLSSGPKDRMN